MKMVQSACLCFIVGFASISLAYSQGSTNHLKDIVLGRCWDFQWQKVHKEATKNCSKIWETFYKAFAHKDPCNTTFKDYWPYFDEIGMDTVKPNKSLFWSGTYKQAHLFSDFDARFTTLEDTMAGWIVNGLAWCGTQANKTDGINYASCPKITTSCDYLTPFWGQASRRFAEKASGIVRVMVNGTRMESGKPIPAFRNNSFFGQYELPYFHVKQIIRLLILVVHSIEGPDLETCNNGSIKLMQEVANRRGIKTTCYDDPDDVRHLLCADHPTSRECLFFTNGMIKTQPVKECSGSWKIVAIIMLGIVAAFSLIAAVIGAMIYAKRYKENHGASINYKRHAEDA